MRATVSLFLLSAAAALPVEQNTAFAEVMKREPQLGGLLGSILSVPGQITGGLRDSRGGQALSDFLGSISGILTGGLLDDNDDRAPVGQRPNGFQPSPVAPYPGQPPYPPQSGGFPPNPNGPYPPGPNGPFQPSLGPPSGPPQGPPLGPPQGPSGPYPY